MERPGKQEFNTRYRQTADCRILVATRRSQNILLIRYPTMDQTYIDNMSIYFVKKLLTETAKITFTFKIKDRKNPI